MEYVRCHLCGSDDGEELFPSTLDRKSPTAPEVAAFQCTSSRYGVHPPVVRCRVCGLVYTNPRYEADLLRDRYEKVVDITYVREQRGRVLTFRRHLNTLEGMVAPGSDRRLLDVGCYTGVFLEIAGKHGWQAQGVELSHWAADEARRHGLRVFTGTLADAAFPDKAFDVVTMWDVIEHLPAPLNDLREIHRVLKPQGLLCIHTMDIESLVARIMGQRWPWLMEMHLYYFSRPTLFKMLTQANFQPIKAMAQGRFLTLEYLLTRLKALGLPGARVLQPLVEWVKLGGVPVPINLGDLFTTYARKVEAEKTLRRDIQS